MASCPPSQVVAMGRAFDGLSPKQVRVAQLALLANWLKTLDATADVTPNGILRRAAYFGNLAPGQIRMLTLQLLCEISS